MWAGEAQSTKTFYLSPQPAPYISLTTRSGPAQGLGVNVPMLEKPQLKFGLPHSFQGYMTTAHSLYCCASFPVSEP